MRVHRSLALAPVLFALAAPARGPAAGAAGAAVPGLSAREEAIAAAVDRGLPEALALLRESVDINSGTMNFAGVREVGRLFRKRFESLGFSARWVDGADWGRAGHVVAARAGAARAPRVLFIGHLDTVFEADSPFQRFEAQQDTTALGPGVIDMKGGIVVMLLALGALAEEDALDSVSVTVVLTGDEEKCGEPVELARRELREAADWADVAIGFEDGDGDPETAVIARRGATRWRLTGAGTPAHSSQIFRDDIGSGAIYEAARILTAFHDSLGGEPHLTFNPGVILGGTSVSYDPEQSRGTAFGKVNVIAESTVVAGDLRALSEEQRERAKSVMRRIVGRHLPRTSASIEFEDAYPPLAPTAGNEKLLALFDRASRDLGFGEVSAVDPARAGAADISFTAGLVEMALDGVGLMGDGGHTLGETADLRTLAVQAKRVAVLLSRLGNEVAF
jgi:glutamate carboxypeptidase